MHQYPRMGAANDEIRHPSPCRVEGGDVDGLPSAPMAYDEDLAHRIRELLAIEAGVREQRMFGGLAFLVHGHLAVAASRQGGILVRVDPSDADRLVTASAAELAVMGGRTMRGWLRVAPEQLRTKRQLARWVQRAVDHARSLPPKGARVLPPKAAR